MSNTGTHKWNSLIHPVIAPGWVHGLLAGKPVAVTSNRGQGRVPLRPGANPQLEQQYYQRKHIHLQPGEVVIPNLLWIVLTLIFKSLAHCIHCIFLYMSCFIVTCMSKCTFVLPPREGRWGSIQNSFTRESWFPCQWSGPRCCFSVNGRDCILQLWG